MQEELQTEAIRANKLQHFRDILRQIVTEYASYKPSNGDVETEAIIDPGENHYEVMHVGWDGPRRVHGAIIHIDIRDGKIWIQYDGTDRPVADELLAAGIPQQDIVLAFHPPNVRPHTGFAVG